jgi:AmmeMemoRadiSam system protein B
MTQLNPNSCRPSAVGGRFYAANPRLLAGEVERFLAEGLGETGGFPKAIIAPHAGYQFSGPIAGSAFRPWRQHQAQIQQVILIGPSHYASFAGLALSQHGVWRTPLGEVTVAAKTVERICHLPGVHFAEEAHLPEHSLEVELPFLQTTLKSFSVVPILTGEVSDDDVAELIGLLWDEPGTVFVISSDLSHYYDYNTASQMDRATADAIEELQPSQIHPSQACGRLAIQGLLQVAEDKKCQSVTVDLRNSGDTAGSKDRVVGYGAFTFTPE